MFLLNILGFAWITDTFSGDFGIAYTLLVDGNVLIPHLVYFYHANHYQRSAFLPGCIFYADRPGEGQPGTSHHDRRCRMSDWTGRYCNLHSVCRRICRDDYTAYDPRRLYPSFHRVGYLLWGIILHISGILRQWIADKHSPECWLWYAAVGAFCSRRRFYHVAVFWEIHGCLHQHVAYTPVCCVWDFSIVPRVERLPLDICNKTHPPYLDL